MAVSLDLRQRAVGAYLRGEGSIQALAARFAVGSSSLDRWLKRNRDTGSVERAPRSGGPPRRVTPAGEALIREWFAEDPSLAQHVVADRLADAGQPAVTQQTAGRAIQRMGLTRKKSRSALSSASATMSWPTPPRWGGSAPRSPRGSRPSTERA